jgi:hypothetical protein
MFTTPADLFNIANNFYTAIPKTQEDTKIALEKVQNIFNTEYENTQDMWQIYQKSTTGDASITEIIIANKKAAELLKSTAFAGLLIFPGTFFILPLIIAKARSMGLDIVPDSVSKEFPI